VKGQGDSVKYRINREKRYKQEQIGWRSFKLGENCPRCSRSL